MRLGPKVVPLVLAALCCSADATIMNGSFSVGISPSTSDVGSGAFTVAGSPDFAGSDPLSNIDFTFDFDGDRLTLTVDLDGEAQISTTVNWLFTGIGFTDPLDEITGITRREDLDNGTTGVSAGFTADSLTIQTPDEMATGGDNYTYIYDISRSLAVTPVPEPSSCALFLVGGLAAWRIRRKRAA